MKGLYWNNQELKTLESWDWVKRYSDMHQQNSMPSKDVNRKILHEAHLLVINKLIIVYRRGLNKAGEIVSYREFYDFVESSSLPYTQIKFHPVNFKTPLEFELFVKTEREKLFKVRS